MRLLGVKRFFTNRFANPPRSNRPFKPARIPRRFDADVRTVESRDLVTLTPTEKRSRRHIVFFHGGGFVLEAESFYWRYAYQLVDGAACRLTMVDYPVAPESSAAESFEMIRAAWGLLGEVYPDDEFVLVGDSAGGSISLSLARELAELEHARQPTKCVLISPVVKLPIENEDAFAIERHDRLLNIRALNEHTLPGWAADLPHDHHYVSSMNGGLAGLPPTLVVYGTYDVLSADIEVMRATATEVGADMTFRRFEKMQHDFPVFPIPEGKAATREIIEFATN